MRITILTLFPEMFEGFKNSSIIKRAIGNNIVEVNVVNIRDFTLDKYKRVDTPPIGGGAGLIMKCQPIYDALMNVKKDNSHVIMMSPKGKTYSQKDAIRLSKFEDVILICGHYEGVDYRIEKYVDELISIGDYILTGGEIPSMAISDSIIRLLDGAISEESLSEESFTNDLLEYPQYTEPREFDGKKVPNILYTGNHTAIDKYRRKKALEETIKYRKDLLNEVTLSKQDLKLLKELENNETPKWENDAIEKGHKFIHKK